MRGYDTIVISWTMVIVTFLLISLRLCLHVPHRLRTPADALVVIAWLLFVIQTTLTTELHKMGIMDGKPVMSIAKHEDDDTGEQMVTVLKIFYTQNIIYFSTMYCIKGAFVLFYYDLIPFIMTKTRIALHITAATVLASFIVTICVKLFLCIPISRNWSYHSIDFCSTALSARGIFAVIGLHLLTDLMICALPFSLFYILSLSFRQKVGVAITFSLGFLCIGFCLSMSLSLYLNVQPAVFYLFTELEQTWALIVVCSPSLKKLFSDDFRACGRFQRRRNEVKENQDVCDGYASTEVGSKRSSSVLAGRPEQDEESA